MNSVLKLNLYILIAVYLFKESVPMEEEISLAYWNKFAFPSYAQRIDPIYPLTYLYNSLCYYFPIYPYISPVLILSSSEIVTSV
jgi:hypothetical protein